MSLTQISKGGSHTTTKKKSSKLLRSRYEVGAGDICNLKITALAANNIGIDDSSFAYTVFVPNAKIGSQIKSKIVKVKTDTLASLPYSASSYASSPRQAQGSGEGGGGPHARSEFFTPEGVSLRSGLVPVSKAYAVGQLLEVTSRFAPNEDLQCDVKPGDKLTVSIKKQIGNGKAGVVELANKFILIVPLTNLQIDNNFKQLENIEVIVTRVKLNYAFAKIEKNIKSLNHDSNTLSTSLRYNKGEILKSTQLEVGSKFTTTINLSSGYYKGKSLSKGKYKFLVLKVKDLILFLKLNNSVFTDSLNQSVRVRIKITSKSANCVVGKVLQVNPVSKTKKMSYVLKNICEMINHGLHFGEKAVKCNARMKNYLWLTNSDTTLTGKNTFLGSNSLYFRNGSEARRESQREKKHSPFEISGAVNAQAKTVFAHSLIPAQGESMRATAGKAQTGIMKGKEVNKINEVNFINPSLHKLEKQPPELRSAEATTNGFVNSSLERSNSNAKVARAGPEGLEVQGGFYLHSMGSEGKENALRSAKLKKPYIKKGRHVINLLKTRRCLNQALKKLTQYALKNRTFLFIGTKKPASSLIARASFFTKNSFYVNTRWLGGMLTNWKTICKSILKIRPILKEKQKVICNVLEKRQIIKKRLIKKALLLKQKSKVILNKGSILLQTLKKDKLDYISNAKKLTALTHEFVNKGYNYIEKRQQLIEKRTLLISETMLLKEKGLDLWLKHKTILNQLSIYAKKLRQYKYLLILTAEIQSIKNAVRALAKPNTAGKAARSVGSLQEAKPLPPGEAQGAALLSLPPHRFFPEGERERSDEGVAGSETNSASLTAQGSLRNSSQTNEYISLLSVAYSKLADSNQKSNTFKELELANQEGQYINKPVINWILPNPPKDFLNLMVTASLNDGKFRKGAKVSASLAKRAQTAYAYKSSNFAYNKSYNKRKNEGSKFIVCSTLLAKFSNFNIYVKSVIKSIFASIQVLQSQSNFYISQLNKIQSTLQTYLNLKQKYSNELINLKFKFSKEKGVFRIVTRKLKALECQKKLLNFLPRLQYLPTPQAKISEIVQILLSRIVDPKLKYPIEQIYDQKLSGSSSSKKLAVTRKKKWILLEKYFGGIANMTKLTKTQISRNIAIIVGQNEEINAVRECKKLGVKMFTIVDTNCNPTLSDHIIPANDDSRSSIQYILTKFVTRIRLAQKLRSRLYVYMSK